MTWVGCLPNIKMIHPKEYRIGDILMHPVFTHPMVLARKRGENYLCLMMTSNPILNATIQAESRFNQALENIFPNNEELDIKKLREVIRWIVNDVLKEEMDTMKENGLEPKEINSKISVKARQMFLTRYNQV